MTDPHLFTLVFRDQAGMGVQGGIIQAEPFPHVERGEDMASQMDQPGHAFRGQRHHRNLGPVERLLGPFRFHPENVLLLGVR